MNPFSIGLYAPLMSEALLYTTLLPLEIHLQEMTENTIISVTQYVHRMRGWRHSKQHCVFNA